MAGRLPGASPDPDHRAPPVGGSIPPGAHPTAPRRPRKHTGSPTEPAPRHQPAEARTGDHDNPPTVDDTPTPGVTCGATNRRKRVGIGHRARQTRQTALFPHYDHADGDLE